MSIRRVKQLWDHLDGVLPDEDKVMYVYCDYMLRAEGALDHSFEAYNWHHRNFVDRLYYNAYDIYAVMEEIPTGGIPGPIWDNEALVRRKHYLQSAFRRLTLAALQP